MTPYLAYLNDVRYRPYSSEQRRRRAALQAEGLAPLKTMVPSPLAPVMGSQEDVRQYLSYLDNRRFRTTPSRLPKAPEPMLVLPTQVPVSHQEPTTSLLNGLPPAVQDALRLAQMKHPDLWVLDDGMLFRRHFQQLLPLNRDVIMEWGSASLQKVADLAGTVATLTRRYIDLRGFDLLEKMLTDLRRPKNLWERVTRSDTTFTATRHDLTTLHDRVHPLLKECERITTEARAAEQRLAVLLASFSIIATTAANESARLVQSIQERSSLLAQSLQQAALLAPQVKALDAQMVDLISRVDEALNVTLPALELARAHNV